MDARAKIPVDPLGLKWVDTFQMWGGLAASSRILDIGCGPGRMAKAIGETFGFQNPYVGFDVRGADVRLCQEAITSRHPNFQFLEVKAFSLHHRSLTAAQASSVRFPAADNSIDFCFATSIFTHLFGHSTEHYVHEAARVLAPNGVFLSSWFVRGGEANRPRYRFPYKWTRGTRFQYLWSPGFAVSHDPDVIWRLFDRAGLSVTFHRGAWHGEQARHSQDVIVAKRMSSAEHLRPQ